jgi:anti-sigma28 factor (negative regulator of flagellin synthesis)
MTSIQDLGPIEMGRPGIDRAHDQVQRTAATQPGDRAPSPAPAPETAAVDRIELSLAARALSTAEDAEIAARRSEHVATMRTAIEAGDLASAERVERAARRLLGG